MPTVTALSHAATVSAPRTTPTDAEVRAIRKALSGDPGPAEIDLKKTPKPVQAFAARVQKQEGRDTYVSAQTFTIGAKRYYVVDANVEGNGHATILDPRGNQVTGYSYTESSGPRWLPSAGEAGRDKAASDAAAKLFTRSALGTAKLAKYEIKSTALPQALQDQVKYHTVKDEHFYKLNVGGQTMYVDYVLYRGTDTKPNSTIGSVVFHNSRGAWVGSADILNKSTDRLKFTFDLGRS